MTTVSGALSEASTRMAKSVDALKRELGAIRTGRANPALVQAVMVDYYGVPTPLGQLATISVPEARVLSIQPWDKGCLREVEKGILRSDLGLVPNNDGTLIRINIPTPTEERRRDLAKLVARKVEESRVAVRNVRRDALDRLRGMERDKEISQDEGKRAQEQLQRLTDANISQMEALHEEKEAEVMEV